MQSFAASFCGCITPIVSPIIIVLSVSWSGYYSHLKKTFCSHIFVAGKILILGIFEYASGLNFASASIQNQNPFFEMACRIT